MSFAATWMDPVIVILSEKDKDRYHVIRFICASLKKKKNRTKEVIYKTEIESQMQKTKLALPGGQGEKLADWD